MWTYSGKQIALAINIEPLQRIQFVDGTVEPGFNLIKSLRRGIFVNPSLDKKKYLSLLKVFHPDVSNLDSHLATQIAQAIINAKDGVATAASPWKTNDRTRSPHQTNTESNSQSGRAKYDWGDWVASNRKDAQRQNSRSHQKPEPEELDFETWLSFVPTKYWKMFGAADTFERDKNVNFRIFKRCYYGYFDTELEIVFRKGCIYREKVTAIHRNIIYILNQINLSSLTKKDLWSICEVEALGYSKSQRKEDLIEEIKERWQSGELNSQNSPGHYWSLIVTSPRPLWKQEFIEREYHANFEQFNDADGCSQRRKASNDSCKQDDTSSYFNCGQYLKLKKQWLERDEFLYFLRLTRNLAKKLEIQTRDEQGYPGYPIEILDLAWQKMSV